MNSSKPESSERAIAVPQSDKERSFWRRANNTRTMRIPNQPNLPQAILKWSRPQKFYFQIHPLIPGHLAELSGSPEKAGVSGPIPALATI
jgi:hypothetical protein